MEIEGTYTLQAPTEEVWHCLMDQQTIRHTIPGLERLTRVDEQTYTFAIHIRHAPLRGRYSGRASIVEPRYPSEYRLSIEGEGPGSALCCEFAIKLDAHNENTVISYSGMLQPGSNNARISAPLIKATFKVLLQQFFAALADRLRTERQSSVYVTTPEETYVLLPDEQISELPLETYQSNPPTWLHFLVRQLGLGQHDPLLEEQWVRRLRRAGLVTLLLFLVWVGTRLPRRADSGPQSNA